MGRIERALEQRRRQASQSAHAGTPAAELAGPRNVSLSGLNFAALRRVEPDAEHLAERHVVATLEKSAASEAFKMLRTRVKRSMTSQGLTTLAISSPRASEGKTLVAVNLAFRMASEPNTEVILVDFDLRHPSVWDTLGIDPGVGLEEYLNGSAGLQEVCVCPGPRQLALLLNSRVFDNSSEILSSERVTQLVTELRGEQTPRNNNAHRTVIFDLPPLLSADDLLAFSHHIDGLLLVVTEGKTLRSELAAAFDLLSGINVIGTVLNKSEGRTETYYY